MVNDFSYYGYGNLGQYTSIYVGNPVKISDSSNQSMRQAVQIVINLQSPEHRGNPVLSISGNRGNVSGNQCYSGYCGTSGMCEQRSSKLSSSPR